MILSYRQRLIIHNAIQDKVTELKELNLTSLNDDYLRLMTFAVEVLECDRVEFKYKEFFND